MTYRSVYCTASTHDQANRVIRRLEEIEFPAAETSVLFLESGPAGALNTSKAFAKTCEKKTASTLPRAARGPLLVAAAPSEKPLHATGPVAMILGDAATYGIAGGLREFGVPATEALRYEAHIKEGHVFLSVRTENPDKSDLARGIFASEGGEDIRTLMDVLTPKIDRKRSPYGYARVSLG